MYFVRKALRICKWKSHTKKETCEKNTDLPLWKMQKIEPVFPSLTNTYIPEKCFYGISQTCNESFNKISRNWCPINIPKCKTFVQ